MEAPIVWWIWILSGIALLLAELLTPGGFYFLFFAMGAMVTGVASRLWPMEAGPQALLFFAVSVVSLTVFRRPLLAWLERKNPKGVVDPMIGEIALPQSEIPPSGMGQAELRGSLWAAQNLASVPLQSGQRCRVVGIDGLTIHIQPESH